jgi:hypothetical protein
MKRYTRKTKDVYILLGNYGQGFEELCSEESQSEIKQRYKEYIENDTYSRGFKIIKKRENL